VICKCDLCWEKRETRYIDLYPWGSEGLGVCHGCEMKLVKVCQEMALETLRRRKAEHVARRSAAEQEAR